MVRTVTDTPSADALESDEGAALQRFREAVKSGRDWLDALLEAIAEWTLPEERVGDREYRYLIAGEAFDWQLLAERIVIHAYDCLPPLERDRFLLHGKTPRPISDNDFREAIGDVKHSAVTNFWYGVRVEEALLLAVEIEVRKSRYIMGKTDEPKLEDLVHNRIYGKDRRELLQAYAASQEIAVPDSMTIGELNEFTYWLFKYRVGHCDKARVASDTKKGLLQLQKLEGSHVKNPRSLLL